VVIPTSVEAQLPGRWSKSVAEAALINQRRSRSSFRRRARPKGSSTVTYEDIGGIKKRSEGKEMIELPLRHSGDFEKLGVEAPKEFSCMALREPQDAPWQKVVCDQAHSSISRPADHDKYYATEAKSER